MQATQDIRVITEIWTGLRWRCLVKDLYIQQLTMRWSIQITDCVVSLGLDCVGFSLDC